MHFKVALLVTSVIMLLQLGGCASFAYSSPNFALTDFAGFGSALISANGIRVGQQGDIKGSIVYYNQSLQLVNGFTTQFTINISNCDSTYLGADGFAFVLSPQLPAASISPPGGSSIGITSSKNTAVVGFLLVSDILTVCAVNSSSDFGGSAASLRNDLTHCIQNSTSSNNAMRNLRCSGPHTIRITFTSPAAWEIVIDNSLSYTFTKDINQTLNWGFDYTGYVGFSGGVGAGYMTQLIIDWSFDGCDGKCDPSAKCLVDPQNTASLICECPAGFFGDGTEPCVPVRTNNIIPILECYESQGYSNYEAFYGYQSSESEVVAIPKGVDNNFYGWADFDPLQYFEPGRSPFYPFSAFSVPIEAGEIFSLTWHLGNYEVSFTSNDTSKLCPSNLTVKLQFITGRQLDANETSLILDQLYTLLEISYGRLSVRNITYTPYNSKRQVADLAELELEIAGTNETTSSEPRASEAVQKFVQSSSNTTLMNEVVNPDPTNPDPDRNFYDVKTTSVGTETVGRVLPQPIAPIAPVPPSVPSTSPTDPPSLVPTKQTSSTSSSPSIIFVGEILILAMLSYTLL